MSTQEELGPIVRLLQDLDGAEEALRKAREAVREAREAGIPKPPPRPEFCANFIEVTGNSARTRGIDVLSTPELIRLLTNIQSPPPSPSVWDNDQGPWWIDLRWVYEELTKIGFLVHANRQTVQIDFRFVAYWQEADSYDGGFLDLARDCLRLYKKGVKRGRRFEKVAMKWTGQWSALLGAAYKILEAKEDTGPQVGDLVELQRSEDYGKE